MEKGITLKVWKMDYSFLIKNYLNPELWQKTWTLFEYKNFKITLQIYSIKTKNETIDFEIRCHYPDEDGRWVYSEKDVLFSLKIDDLSFLKRQINSAIYDTIIETEGSFIQRDETYRDLIERKYLEQEKLEKICEDFLDKSEVSNGNLREAYIDAYIEEYAKLPGMMSDYIESRIFTELTDFYLVWLNTLEDDTRKESRLETIKSRLSASQWEKVQREISDYQEYMETEEWEEEARSNLEEV